MIWWVLHCRITGLHSSKPACQKVQVQYISARNRMNFTKQVWTKIVLWADPDEAKPTVSDVFSTKHVRWNDNDSWFQMLRYKLQQLLLIRWKGPKHSEPACCIQQRLSGKIEGIIATSLYKYLPNSHEQKEIVWGLNTIPDRLGAK